MPPKRHRRPPPRPPHLQEQSDYDSETLHTDSAAQLQTQDHVAHTVPARTNEELNLTVLKRHNPQIQQILSVAPYVVVYTYLPSTQTWEKTGIEGTLFICQLIPAVVYHGEESSVVERYSVMVLNRKGLENLSTELHTSAAVDVSDEFVMLEVKRGDEDEEESITYGFWIFSETGTSTEHARVVNAQVMVEFATRSEQSREAANRAIEEYDARKEREQQREEEARHNGYMGAQQNQQRYEHRQPTSQQGAGQPASLLDLFGVSVKQAPRYQDQNGAQYGGVQGHGQQQYSQPLNGHEQHRQHSNQQYNQPLNGNQQYGQPSVPPQNPPGHQGNLLSLFGQSAGQQQGSHQPPSGGQAYNGIQQQQYSQQNPYGQPQQGYLPHAHPQQMQHQQLPQQPQPTQAQNLLSLFR